MLAARSEAEAADVVRSLPAPVALTSPERRLARPLEIHSGLGRLRLAGRWQVAAETHISADLGSIRLDLTGAEFDGHVIDLHVYTGWGSITIIVPSGEDVQVIRHRGGVDSRLDPPVPGLPLVRLDVTTNIGRVHLRHPGTLNRTRRWPGGKRRTSRPGGFFDARRGSGTGIDDRDTGCRGRGDGGQAIAVQPPAGDLGPACTATACS